MRAATILSAGLDPPTEQDGGRHVYRAGRHAKEAAADLRQEVAREHLALRPCCCRLPCTQLQLSWLSQEPTQCSACVGCIWLAAWLSEACVSRCKTPSGRLGLVGHMQWTTC